LGLGPKPGSNPSWRSLKIRVISLHLDQSAFVEFRAQIARSI